MNQLVCRTSVSRVCLNSDLNAIARVLDTLIFGAEITDKLTQTLVDLLDAAVKRYHGRGSLDFTKKDCIYKVDREQESDNTSKTPCGILTLDTKLMICKYAGHTGDIFWTQGGEDFDETLSLTSSNETSFIKFVKEGLKKMSL